MHPVAVLAGGLGTRLRDVTGHTRPKAMVELAGRPFVDHKLLELQAGGAERVVLLVAHGADELRDHVGDGAAFGLEVTYVEDGPSLLGTGGAVQRALPVLGPRFWITYGDTLLEVDVPCAEERFDRSGALALMTVLENHDRWEPSNVVVGGDRVVEYSKSPRPDGADHIDYGMLLFDARAFADHEAGDAFDLAPLLGTLARDGALAAFTVTEPFHEIGTPEALRATEDWLRSRSR